MPPKVKPTNWAMYGKMAAAYVLPRCFGKLDTDPSQLRCLQSRRPSARLLCLPLGRRDLSQIQPRITKEKLGKPDREAARFRQFRGQVEGVFEIGQAKYVCSKQHLGNQANCGVVWEAAADEERKTREGKIAEQAKLMEEMRARKEEIRKSGTSPVPGGSL